MEDLKNSVSRVVGTKQVLRGLKSGTLAKVYVANDADTFCTSGLSGRRKAPACGGTGSYHEGTGAFVRGGGCVRRRRYRPVTALLYCL